jgi:glutamate-1-semialdehyde 2,1-aminomutase
VAARLAAALAVDGIDVSGIGGTLTGNALALAAVRAALSNALREEDFAVATPLAEAWAAGVGSAIGEAGLPWHVQRLGCRAEYWFCPPPRTGAEAAAATDHELDAFMHLWAINRGILLTPFHNMALMSPATTAQQTDQHETVFEAAIKELLQRA